MKTLLAIILSSLLLCGCSPRQAARAHRASDFVEAGKDVTWLGGDVLRVTNREGSSIRGIRLVTKAPDGLETTVTAATGTVSDGPYPHTVKVTLFNGTSQGVKSRTSFEEMTVILAR
jgi:hypothetical protein